MKNLLFLLLLIPFLGFTQTPEYLIFEIATHKVSPENASQVNNAMGQHNKKYHASGPNGVRVYDVINGSNSGDLKWVMGPGPWSSLDTRPDDEAHNMDWGANVARYMMPGGTTEYIRFDPKLSRFPKDFNVSKLWVQYIDVARGKMDKMKEILAKINKVYADKLPNQAYGIYYNELPSTSSGRDLTVVFFFDKYAWMGMDEGFEAKYDEVYGKGSVDAMWDEWMANTLGAETEIWEYNAELSGMSELVKVAERQ